MLSKRLEAISTFISNSDFVADIGCDHGKLSVYLYQNNITSNIIASDINPNALKNAEKNIKKANLEKYIPTILSDGLANLNLEKINTLIISGMGCHTILKILEDNKKLKNIKKIIIQSNNNLEILRKKIIEKKYYILDEKIVKENNIYYVIICFQKGTVKKVDHDLGIIKKDNKEYYQYLLKKWQEIKIKIPFIKLAKKLKYIKKIVKIKKVINNL